MMNNKYTPTMIGSDVDDILINQDNMFILQVEISHKSQSNPSYQSNPDTKNLSSTYRKLQDLDGTFTVMPRSTKIER